MHVWQLQEAKAKLTQLIKEAKHEPQIISRHGINESVVISLDQYEALLGKKETLAQFFKNSPLYGLELDFERDKLEARDHHFFEDYKGEE
jgi:prevent-host-death family protein